jgi:hypothetical protein
MSKIHINRDRQSLGQFTPEAVSEGLRSGRFLPTDLAWREGMESWQPLETFTDLPAPEEVAPPTIAPGTPLTELPVAAPVAPAWERDPAASLFTRLYETVREVLGAPQATFAGMPTTGGFGKPLTFLVILGSLCGIVSIIYQLVFELVGPKAANASPDVTPAIMTGIFIGLMVCMPLIIALGSFVSAGIFHVALMLVGAAPKSYEATFRVICYANGSTSVLLLLPICGSLVQAAWNLYLLVIGFREVHGTSTGKAIAAVLLPMALCCGLTFAAVALAAAIPAMSQAAR